MPIQGVLSRLSRVNRTAKNSPTYICTLPRLPGTCFLINIFVAKKRPPGLRTNPGVPVMLRTDADCPCRSAVSAIQATSYTPGRRTADRFDLIRANSRLILANLAVSPPQPRVPCWGPCTAASMASYCKLAYQWGQAFPAAAGYTWPAVLSALLPTRPDRPP